MKSEGYWYKGEAFGGTDLHKPNSHIRFNEELLYLYRSILSSRTKVLSDEQVKFIDNEMAKNDELTARQIQSLLVTKWPQLLVSLNHHKTK